jgi:diguanylate cyclase (GGDEF)-like protein
MEESKRPELDKDQIARKVRAEQFRVFNGRLVASVFVAPLGIGLVAWLQYLAAGWEKAAIWSSAMVAIELLIFVVGARLSQSDSDSKGPWLWVKAQTVFAGLLGVAWGASVWFVWNEDKFLFYITNLCVLVGVSNICMVVMSPVRRAALLFSAGMMLPPLVQLSFINNPIALQIGVGWLVMLAVQTRYAADLKRELLLQIDSSVRNVALVALLSDTSRELFNVNAKLEAKNHELERAMEKLNQLVTFDQLTGAYSRRFIFEQLERQVSVSVRHAAPVSIIMFDLDHFKAINDTYGHPTGDLSLQEVSKAVQEQLRDGDMLARVGGEEFLVLLPMTTCEAAQLLGERLRMKLAATSIRVGENRLTLPASFGVAELKQDEYFNDWYRRVDAALYQAKAQGRNRLVVAV